MCGRESPKRLRTMETLWIHTVSFLHMLKPWWSQWFLSLGSAWQWPATMWPGLGTYWDLSWPFHTFPILSLFLRLQWLVSWSTQSMPYEFESFEVILAPLNQIEPKTTQLVFSLCCISVHVVLVRFLRISPGFWHLHCWQSRNDVRAYLRRAAGFLLPEGDWIKIGGASIKFRKVIRTDTEWNTEWNSMIFELVAQALMKWSLERTEEILYSPGSASWNSRWLEVLNDADREGNSTECCSEISTSHRMHMGIDGHRWA